MYSPKKSKEELKQTIAELFSFHFGDSNY